MGLTHFTQEQIIPAIISLLILVSAVLTFHSSKQKISLYLLFFGVLGMGIFISNLDPFLNIWDEQYHALVAKNLMTNPFQPTLYKSPLLSFDFRDWTGNHIWLHKQPLFLWQMALSLKIFGINEFAVRLPSILLHSCTTLMIYRIGKIVINDRVGFYGAIFFGVAFYPLELIVGKFSTDHNDISFLFYITASFWSWFEFERSKQKKWLILIGIFTGGAVLVKWLVGLLIFGVWMITEIYKAHRNSFQIQRFTNILFSFLISCLIFLPWQIYIHHYFPLEAQYELQLNTKHFFEAVENHSGSYWFHFEALKILYGAGDAVPFLLIAGIIILIKNASSRIYGLAILSAILMTYGFYTLAATKMLSFCLIMAPFAFLGLGALIDKFLTFINRKIKSLPTLVFLNSVIIFLIGLSLLNPSKIANNHTAWKPWDNGKRSAQFDQMNLVSFLKKSFDNQYVIFNADVRLNGHIAVMFYTDHLAYDYIPDSAQLEKVKNQSHKIAVVDDGYLSEEIRKDSSIVKIEKSGDTFIFDQTKGL